MNLEMYRATHLEQQRISNIVKIAPRDAHTVLDAGASDGYIALMLARTFDSVVALDIKKPTVKHSRIQAVEGDITGLTFADRAFDMVVCTDVLEHLPTPEMRMACRELRRVARRYVLVGVPYKQDLRLGRTTCQSCDYKNPPWSHHHAFTEQRLCALFPGMEVESVSYVGGHRERTNRISTRLMDWAGNPYGTYAQDAPCIHCGRQLQWPPEPNVLKKTLAKTALTLNSVQSIVTKPRAHWIHMLLRKPKHYAYPPVTVPRRDALQPANVTRLSA